MSFAYVCTYILDV